MANGRKTGGRAKGTPNKKTQDLKAISERLKCDPFEVLLLFAKGDHKALGYKRKQDISPSLRATCASDACQYLHPKRKSVDVNVQERGPVTINFVRK